MTNSDYIREILSCDIYDTETLLSYREKYFNPGQKADAVNCRYDIEETLAALTENFWNMTQEEFTQASERLLLQVESMEDLKKFLFKLCKVNAQRDRIEALKDINIVSQVFIEDFKKILVLRRSALKTAEFEIFENIKKSKLHKSIVRTIKVIKTELPELAEAHDDWLQKVLRVKNIIRQEKKSGGSSFDWIWIGIGIYFILRILGSFIK